MTKILFWVDMLFVNLGIAKYMKNSENELFAIYDLNQELTEIFRKQNIVDFEKEWFFWDQVKKIKKNPDLEYIKKIEEKYELNLWTLIYNDRLFFRFNKIHNFERNEILSILEEECKFYEKIIETVNPEFLIIANTGSHRTHLLKEMCKKRGIRSLMLARTRFGGRTTIDNNYDTMDETWDMDTSSLKDELIFENPLEYKEKYNPRKIQPKLVTSTSTSIKKKIMPALKWVFTKLDEEYKSRYVHFGITKQKVFQIQMNTYVRNKAVKNFIDKNFLKSIEGFEKFIYYPLHVEPERSISIDSPIHNNQLDIITNIAKSIPIGYKLLVKEHPTQRVYAWRDIKYYNELMKLPNVRLLHPSVNPDEIYKKCSLVVTIRGTSGLESAFYDKPSVVFTETIYSQLPHVHKLNNLEELPYSIKTSLGKEIDMQTIKEFLKKIYHNSFEFDPNALTNDITTRFHHGNFTVRRDISLIELNQFFEEQKIIFQKLATEHTKKINMYKKITTG